MSTEEISLIDEFDCLEEEQVNQSVSYPKLSAQFPPPFLQTDEKQTIISYPKFHDPPPSPPKEEHPSLVDLTESAVDVSNPIEESGSESSNLLDFEEVDKIVQLNDQEVKEQLPLTEKDILDCAVQSEQFIRSEVCRQKANVQDVQARLQYLGDALAGNTPHQIEQRRIREEERIERDLKRKQRKQQREDDRIKNRIQRAEEKYKKEIATASKTFEVGKTKDSLKKIAQANDHLAYNDDSLPSAPNHEVILHENSPDDTHSPVPQSQPTKSAVPLLS